MSNKVYFVCQHCRLHSGGFDAHELGCAEDCNTLAIHFLLTPVDENEWFGCCDYCNDEATTCYKVQETAW